MRLALSTLALMTFTAFPALAQDPDSGADPAADDAAAATEAVTDEAVADDVAGDAAIPAGSYDLDPEHSHIVWSYDHMGWSTSNGIVRGLTGTITIDPSDPAATEVKASFPLNALETVSPALDEDMMGEQFFNDAPKDTAITFDSTAVEVTGDKTATLTGDLTLNGVTKPVTLDVTLVNMGEYPMGGSPAVAFEGTGTIKRSDFNLGAFAPAVSDEVEVTVNIEAQKS